MKKLVFYILGEQNLEDLDEMVDELASIWESKKNSMLSFEGGKFYFTSKISGKREEVEVAPGVVSFNEELVAVISDLAKKAKQEAQFISEEPIGRNKQGMDLIGGLHHVINRWMYSYETKCTIFILATDLFIRIITGHYLTNGNKRTGLAFLKLFLWHFGYYLKWSSGNWKDYSKHKTNIEEFIERFQSATNDSEKEAIRVDIISWVENNVIIGLNWR